MSEIPIVKFEEVGSQAASEWGNLVKSAIDSDFTWPECWEEFDSIRRTNPEVSIVRSLYTSTVREVKLKFEPPENAEAADKEFTEFLNSVLADINIEAFKETIMTQIPFMGWGLWEIVPGLRTTGWKAPDGEEWESFNNDGLIGIRKLAWRDQSSMLRWAKNDVGEATGMVQQIWPNQPVKLSLANCVHLIYGDQTTPTGLSPFQAVARLRRIKHALEIVQGMGFEHAAGHVKFTVKAKMTSDAESKMKEAAKAIMTAAQGSYATAIEDQYDFELEDVTFSAAADILKSISYYGMVILQIFAAHFVAVATTADTGSYSAASDHSAIFLTSFNAIVAGFSKQTGRQLARYLRLVNGDKFKNITAYPELKATEVKKAVNLTDYAKFLEVFSAVFPMSEDDARMIRERSKVLPAEQPEEGEDIAKEKLASKPAFEILPTVRGSFENVTPTGKPIHTNTYDARYPSEKEITEAVEVFNAFCDEFYPEFRGLLEAKVINAKD